MVAAMILNMAMTLTVIRGYMFLFNLYEREELEPSWSNQLNTVGMQPHAREYLENQSTFMRSRRKYEMIEGQTIDYCDGIQFSGKP